MLRGSELGVICITILGGLALILSFEVLFRSSDPEIVKAALAIAAISGSAVSLIGGWIGGYSYGKNRGDSGLAPESPKVEK